MSHLILSCAKTGRAFNSGFETTADDLRWCRRPGPRDYAAQSVAKSTISSLRARGFVNAHIIAANFEIANYA